MKRKVISVVLLSLILILTTANGILADDFKLPQPSRYFYVYDDVGIIDAGLERNIISVNETLYSKTGAQIVVAIVKSLEDRHPQDYANLLYREWGIGSKEKDNGVLILLAPNEKQIWIDVGYGLEGALPDGRVGEILDNDMVPYIRDGNYNEGIQRGFNTILNIVQNEYGIELDFSQGNYYREPAVNREVGLFDSIRNILIAIGVVIFLIIDFTFFRGTITFMLLRSAMRGGGRGGRGGGGNRGGGGSSGGGGAGRGW